MTRHRLLKSFNEHGSPGWTINQLPGLRKAALGFCETSSQWVPWVVHEAVRRSLGGEHPVSMSCFRDHGIYVSTQTDDDFSYVISYAGEENIVIGTDYGHGDTSSELNAISRFKAMEGLNPQVKRKILFRQSQTILRDLKKRCQKPFISSPCRWSYFLRYLADSALAIFKTAYFKT